MEGHEKRAPKIIPRRPVQTLKEGMISFATLPHPTGGSKRRPVVVASPGVAIATGEKILVFGISGSYRPDDPNVIPLPWRDDGNICTGFRKPSAITLALKDMVDSKILEPTKWWIGKSALIELRERVKKL
jgi:hypothetical protein